MLLYLAATLLSRGAALTIKHYNDASIFTQGLPTILQPSRPVHTGHVCAGLPLPTPRLSRCFQVITLSSSVASLHFHKV